MISDGSHWLLLLRASSPLAPPPWTLLFAASSFTSVLTPPHCSPVVGASLLAPHHQRLIPGVSLPPLPHHCCLIVNTSLSISCHWRLIICALFLASPHHNLPHLIFLLRRLLISASLLASSLRSLFFVASVLDRICNVADDNDHIMIITINTLTIDK